MLSFPKILRFLSLVCAMLFAAGKGYSHNVPIRYLGIDQGLSNNMVTCIFRDHYGFMWIGTYNGLNRYDGTAFRIFEKNWGNTSSLINNHISSISEDRSNNIWIGTDKGLAVYNYSSSKVRPVFYRSLSDNKIKPVNSRINALGRDSEGNIYIATDENFLICKNGAAFCEEINCLNKKGHHPVQTLTVDHSGRVWIFVTQVGLGYYDTSANRIKIVNTQLKRVSCMSVDQNNQNLWIGTESGLFKYNISQNSLSQTNTVFKLSNNSVMYILPGRSSQLWVATDGGGVNIINTVTGKVSVITSGGSKGLLSSNSVYAIFEDPDSKIWIGTIRGGVNIIDNKGQPFENIANNPQNHNSLISNFTRSFCEDIDHSIWVGTAGSGLSIWNPQLNTFQNYTHRDNDPNSLSSDFALSIILDWKKNIWIATLKGGISKYNRQTHKFKQYICYNNVTGIENPSIWKLYEDSHHNLWAASTRGGGLFKFNNAEDKFELYDSDLIDISAIYEDRAGQLWMANTDLIKIDLRNKKHTRIPLNVTIHAIYEDRNRNFWIGTDGGGLLNFNRKNNLTIRYTKNEGLPDNTVFNILEDENGRLWFSTFNGLCNFNPKSTKVENYFASDGLLSNQFTVNAALKLSTGEMLFGGLKGFNKFNPDSVKTHPRIPNIYVTDFKVNNLSLQDDSSFKGDHDIINMRKITLDYDKAVIAIDYVAPEYSHTDKINYAYFMEGWDHTWNPVGKIRTAYYSRLNEGHYTLHIKSTNTEGIWTDKEKLIDIVILPPWYRTWWACLFYLGLSATVIYVFWLYRTRQTMLRHEIEITNIKAEKERELNERKLSFFTNISHEFKTPLTLIINPIKDILKTAKEGDNNDLNIVYRNAKRLLRLVDHLLLFRKAENESSNLKIVKLDFIVLTQDVYQCFLSQVKEKNINYTFNPSTEYLELYADVEKLEIVLFNLISNAIKFTPNNGKIDLYITHDNNSVTFEVSDSGSGIASEIGNKLFEKYYQIKDSRSVKSGFGIGLYLVKTFTDMHQGTICYNSNAMGGTTFTLMLKKGKNHFTDLEIVKETDSHETRKYEVLESDLILQTEYTEKISLNQMDRLLSDQQSMLIIDDNNELRDYITKMFKTKYKIYEAVNGEEGLAFARQFIPDIIISDINMDVLDGVTLCKIIKHDLTLKHIPIILITGDATPELELKGIETGAIEFISKPFEKDLLMARVNRILCDKSELQDYFYNKVTLKDNLQGISQEDKDFIGKCIVIIENNISAVDFDVQRIADEMSMSYSRLFKKLKLITGHPVNNFIRLVRIRKAAELLINTNFNVNEVALSVGISDVKYFRANFVKVFGINPSEFAKKHRASFGKKYRIQEGVISE